VQFDAKFCGQPDQSLGHRAGTAARIPDAFTGLHVRDAAEHGRSKVGSRADVLREVVEHLGDAAVFHESSDGRPDRAPRAHAKDVAQCRQARRRRRIEHVANGADRPPEEVTLRDVVEPRRQVEEATITETGFSAWSQRIERSGHSLRVCVQVKNRAVHEEGSPLRVERNQVELILQVAPRRGEDSLQNRRHEQDGWPHVEAEPALRENGCFPTEPRVLLEEDNVIASGRQRARRGQTTETAADHTDPT